jgi:archaemetzincin
MPRLRPILAAVALTLACAPAPSRHIIYLQPIGPFANHTPSLQTFEQYTEAFFNLEVSLLDPIPVDSLQATTREWDYGPQLRTDDVLAALEHLLPEDGFLLVGLTLSDLYPGEDWNFVFGYASFDKRVSVYSLLRFDPLIDPSKPIDEDLRPMHVCPVCLRKLHLATGLDPLDHYQRLGEFYGEHAMADEAAWTAARVDYLMASVR